MPLNSTFRTGPAARAVVMAASVLTPSGTGAGAYAFSPPSAPIARAMVLRGHVVIEYEGDHRVPRPASRHLGAHTQGWSALHAALENWAAESELPVVDANAFKAGRFLATAQASGVVPPRAYFGGDGEVAFTWRTPAADAGATFFGDGGFGAVIRTDEGPPYQLDMAQYAFGAEQPFLRELVSVA